MDKWMKNQMDNSLSHLNFFLNFQFTVYIQTLALVLTYNVQTHINKIPQQSQFFEERTSLYRKCNLSYKYCMDFDYLVAAQGYKADLVFVYLQSTIISSWYLALTLRLIFKKKDQIKMGTDIDNKYVGTYTQIQ